MKQRRKHTTDRAHMPVLSCAVLWIVLQAGAYSQELLQVHAADSSGVNVQSSLYRLFSESNDARTTYANGETYAVSIRYQPAFGAFVLSAEQNRFGFAQENSINGLKFSLQQNVQSMRLAYFRAIDWLTIKADVEALRTTDDALFNYECAAGVSLQRSGTPNYQISYRKHTLPFIFAAAYETENARIVNPITMATAGHEVRYEFHAIDCSAGYSRSYPLKRGKDYFYAFTNRSTSTDYWACLKTASEGWKYQIGLQKFSFRTESDLTQESAGFGYIDVDRFYFLKTEASLSHTYENGNLLSLAARYYDAEGSVLGSIESWPFASVVQSLFLNRVYLRAAGKLQAQEIDASLSFHAGSIEILPQCSLIRVVPELTMETWQPLILAFGVSNYSRTQLTFREAGICYLRIAAARNVWGIRLGIEGHQIIPVYSVPLRTAAPGPGQGSPSSGARAFSSADGGRWFRIWIGLPM